MKWLSSIVGVKDGSGGSSGSEPDRAGQPTFREMLFGHAAAEDLSNLDDDSQTRLAARALSHLSAPRDAGHPSIRLDDTSVVGPRGARDVTILEIVNDDMPFLLDSTLAELTDQGLEPRLVAHPILSVDRLGEAVTDIRPAEPGTRRESLIHIELDRLDDEAARTRLVAGLNRTLADVRVAVSDWAAMRARVEAIRDAYRESPPPVADAEAAESIAFLDWIAKDNFTLLGTREYRYSGEGEAAGQVEGTGLGILRDPSVFILRKGRELVVTTPEIRAFLDKPVALIITKANVKSRVHRRVHLDYIGVKVFEGGRLAGELRIVGLFRSNVYSSTSESIPYLRRKVAQVVERAGFDPASYSGRALVRVLDSYPRDELFQVDIDTLEHFALAILQLSERPRLRALARPDEFDRFVSILVFIPKDRYDSVVRARVAAYLAQVYKGRVSAAYPAYPDGPLSRTHFIIGRDEGETPVIPQEELEAGIAAIVRTWADVLKSALEAEMDGRAARRLAARYGEAFGADYREAFAGREVIADIGILEKLPARNGRAVDLYRREGDPDTRAQLKVYTTGVALPLSERVPVLEHLGFRVINERTYQVLPDAAETPVWLHDMALERATGGAIDVAVAGPLVEAALMAQFRGLAVSDAFDALVLEAGLAWRNVALVRTLGRYLRQARIAYPQDYLAATLARHPALTTSLVDLFHARFDPHLTDDSRQDRDAAARSALDEGLSAVTSLDDDRILRRFLNLIDAAVRTNFFQIGANGFAREVIALKFASAKIEPLPLPKPLYEIFLSSPRVEGVHLRFGKVARGGIRWSDRPQDFRTEVLSLVKAQQVKNAVIVPVGAKGGFVPQQLPPASDRAAWLAEGTEAYRIFIRTLLELTDNYDKGKVVPPADTVRLDGDDPYLVVAADKGTATFSDTANALSLEKGHWLGDAFASGGSVGYDHKKMGITARGAWEAVKRHFREIDIDIQSQQVTVAGVGDMSGDVFGNGMLLSKALKLVAAFDHRDIFIDPNPDPAASHTERQRLFDLPRSSWADYDKALISPGGGVFSRSLKSIPLSPEMQALLGTAAAALSPPELMTAILKAKVDLLWFGGIGTYIRASDETDDQAGDRANDAIRITGSDVAATVVGEGANLGVTQRGRIEAAKRGIRLNTDAIDNSAGVNTSDVEVNIKIALTEPVREGRLTEDARNALLAEMTDDVGALVLRNNYLQTLTLSLTQARGAGENAFLRRLMRRLEADGRLDRGVEFLPSDREINERERRGEGLTRPELAVLLAYAKLSLHDAILDSDLPDEPAFAGELTRYFPSELQIRFPDEIARHRLRREIVSTQLANAVVNRGGPAIVTRLAEEAGADAPAVVRGYVVAREAYGLLDLNNALDALDGRVKGAVQLRLYTDVQDLTFHAIAWFARNAAGMPLKDAIAFYKGGIAEVAASLDGDLLPAARDDLANRRAALVADGVPETVAAQIASLPAMAGAPDIVAIARDASVSVTDAAATYFAVDDAFRIAGLLGASRHVAVADEYDRLALDGSLSLIASAHRRLTASIVRAGGRGTEGVGTWTGQRAGAAERVRTGIDAIVSGGITVSKLTVAAGMLDELAR